MLYSWDRLNKIGPIKNNRLSVQIEKPSEQESEYSL